MKIAVLGLGFMGSMHLKALRTIPGAQLAAVFSKDEKKLSGDLTDVRGNLGGPGEVMDFRGVKRYRDIGELLADREIEAVDLCLPTDLHTSVTIDALRAGKHVLVEKPMALDGESADRMIAEAGRTGKTLMTAQVLRFFPEYVALREAMQSGRHGRTMSAVFRRRCGTPSWGGWLNDAAKSGGGVFDLLIHDIDMTLHLFGAPEAVSATGLLDAQRGLDFIHAQLFYRNGLVVLVTGGWHPPASFPFSMEFTVSFETATIDYSSAGRPVTLYAPEGAAPVETANADAYRAEVEYFVECCRTGAPPTLCPPEESAQAVKLMLAILEARNHNGEKITCRI